MVHRALYAAIPDVHTEARVNSYAFPIASRRELANRVVGARHPYPSDLVKWSPAVRARYPPRMVVLAVPHTRSIAG